MPVNVNLNGIHQLTFNFAGTIAASLTSPGAVTVTNTLGTMATENANAVVITGGSIDGTPVGSITPAAVSGTTATFSGVMTAPTLVSTVATGTAPLTVTSTTPVANLSAALDLPLTGGTLTGSLSGTTATFSGVINSASLATTQTPAASATASDHSIPIALNGVTYYIRLSTTA